MQTIFEGRATRANTVHYPELQLQLSAFQPTSFVNDSNHRLQKKKSHYNLHQMLTHRVFLFFEQNAGFRFLIHLSEEFKFEV
jgi:hypothetical protein